MPRNVTDYNMLNVDRNITTAGLFREFNVTVIESGQMPQSPIELKGSNFTLSVVHLHHSQPEVIHRALQEKIDQAPAFFHHAPVVINITALEESINWDKIHQVFTSVGLRVVGISGCENEEQKSAIVRAGLSLIKEGHKAKPIPPPLPPPPCEKTLIIGTPVRSGQQIYARHCDLIVTSGISAGAELIADGNIHIYGTMRGRALAGASGDTGCQIFSTQMNAELLSIAGHYWLSEQIPADFIGRAARIKIVNDELKIQSLS